MPNDPTKNTRDAAKQLSSTLNGLRVDPERQSIAPTSREWCGIVSPFLLRALHDGGAKENLATDEGHPLSDVLVHADFAQTESPFSWADGAEDYLVEDWAKEEDGLKEKPIWSMSELESVCEGLRLRYREAQGMAASLVDRVYELEAVVEQYEKEVHKQRSMVNNLTNRVKEMERDILKPDNRIRVRKRLRS